MPNPVRSSTRDRPSSATALIRSAPGKRRRLRPEDREREILAGAVQFFAEVGFDGGLRDLANRLGITHQNLFRYFPTKEALIEQLRTIVFAKLGEWKFVTGRRYMLGIDWRSTGCPEPWRMQTMLFGQPAESSATSSEDGLVARHFLPGYLLGFLREGSRNCKTAKSPRGNSGDQRPGWWC